MLLLLHVASVVLSGGPEWVAKVTVVLVVLPLCGLGISVMHRPVRTRVPV